MRYPMPASLLLVAVLATSVFSHAYAASDPSDDDPILGDRISADDADLLDSLDEATLERLRAQASPMIRAWDLDLEQQMQQPIPEIESGIGPGSALRISRPDGTFSCTANFIWTDDFDQLYLGTAGHCLLPDDATATHGPGADYDRNDTRVDVRTGECPISGAGVACSVGGSGSPWESLGSVTYARYTQLGTDFGLVEIPRDLEDQVRYEMPMWGGPDREGTMSLGDNVFHYGQGIAYGEAFASRGRTGLGASSGGGNWEAAGFSNPGDSGSAVVTGGPGAIEGERAIGLLTHGIGLENVPVPGLFFGTHTEKAKTMVGDETGLRVWTLPGGEPLAGMEKPEGENNTTNLEPGTVVVRHENEETTTTQQNYRWSNGWDRVRIIVNAESEEGEVRLQVRDEDNNTVFSMDTQASYSNDRVVDEAPRNIWNLTFDFEGHVGTIALRIEQADDDDEDSTGSSGGSGGSGDPGSGEGETSDAENPDEDPRPLPGPTMGLVVLLVAALVFRLRRR